MPGVVSAVVPAAGIGSRMGLNRPKVLLKIGDESLLQRHLRLIGGLAEPIVVAGYNVHAMYSELANLGFKGIMVVNHNFLGSGTAASVKEAAKVSAEGLILLLDGDLLVSEDSMGLLLTRGSPALGIGRVQSREPVYAHIDWVTRTVVHLSQTEPSEWEWSGLSLIPRHFCASFGQGNVFDSLGKFLPLPAVMVDWWEIDFPNDLDFAKEWLRKQGEISNRGRA